MTAAFGVAGSVHSEGDHAHFRDGTTGITDGYTDRKGTRLQSGAFFYSGVEKSSDLVYTEWQRKDMVRHERSAGMRKKSAAADRKVL